MSPQEIMEFVAMAVAVAFSVGFAYVPGLRERFDVLDGLTKRIVVGVSSLLAVYGLALMGCMTAIDWLPCSGGFGDAALSLSRAFILSIMASQGAYTYLVQKYKSPSWPNDDDDPYGGVQ